MEEKHLMLPKASVRRIMKLSDEVVNVSAEALVLVSKATEEFLSQLIRDSHQVCNDNNRKIIKLEDILTVIEENGFQLEFLEGAFAQAPKTA